MNNKEIRIKIAEACGWTNVHMELEDCIRGKAPGKECDIDMTIPDYCDDLNAMHEAEKILSDELVVKYPVQKYKMHLQKILNTHYKMNWFTLTFVSKPLIFHATARQRAEAFLKTIEEKE